MVWFQCEDCGDNLKKPKLPGHFRVCSANKLSCIDCGQVFGQQSVQGHTQCISEMEKYGPKGQGKASTNTTSNTKSDSKTKPEVDTNVGLSERPPWFCSLCNTSATSRQTLLLHADGKKHRAKARAFHASKQPPKQTEELTSSAKISAESNTKDQLVGNEEAKKSGLSEVAPVHNGSETGMESANLRTSKKRKHDDDKQDANGDMPVELGKHKVDKVLDSTSSTKEVKKNIKWKKLISSALQSNPDRALKLRKVQKLVQKALVDSEITLHESQIKDILEQKIKSSSKFTVDGKYVRLVAKN